MPTLGEDTLEGKSPFSAKEEERVLKMASDLGSDSDGLSSTDRAEIERLVHSIGAANGDPDESKNRAGSPAHISFLVGVPLTAIGIFWTVLSRVS
ncbi:hypothetical protein [Streptomyces sp. NPDC050704]|uniref:hypothetical protein n=1 Tax=Streptomyces sp. NPDC050704 TaxID=3157219 RepID=UPI003429C9DB